MKGFKKGSIVILVCIFLLTGCGKTTDTEESKGADGQALDLSGIYSGELEQNITLRVLENDTAIEQGYFDELMNAFNEKYAEYRIVAIDANMDQYSNLADDGPYGYGPDVIYQANDILMGYVDGKHIYPIPVNTMECYEQIPENAWDAYKAEVDGVTYYMGVPVNVQSSMFFYRKDLLPDNWENDWDKNQNNIPDMTESWNDLFKYSKSIVEQGEGKYGYMRSLYDVYFSSGFLFTYGGYVFGDNNTNIEELGFSAGNAEIGANILKQLASVMNDECIDNSISNNVYSKMAEGTYFATMTTPDVHTLFTKELALVYEAQGMSKEEAQEKVAKNLIVADVPMLPKSGDLTEENPELIPLKAMGGVNGYGISAYTQYPNASLAFVEFATSYEMAMKRNEKLGIVPARKDAAKDVGGVTGIMFDNLDSGNIVVMPSNQAMGQVWTPAETFFQDLAKDAFRTTDKKYNTLEEIKAALQKVDEQIYDAIHTLSSN